MPIHPLDKAQETAAFSLLSLPVRVLFSLSLSLSLFLSFFHSIELAWMLGWVMREEKGDGKRDVREECREEEEKKPSLFLSSHHSPSSGAIKLVSEVSLVSLSEEVAFE